MARYHGDALDEACEENLGHTNWGYATLKDLEEIVAKEKARIEQGKQSEGINFGDDIECVVIFYEASDRCPKCDVHEIDCECEEENEDGYDNRSNKTS